MILNNFLKRFLTSLALLLLVLLILNYDIILVYCLILLSVVSVLEFLKIINKILRNKIFIAISSFLFISYIFLFSVMFFILNNFIQLKFILFVILLGCVASDLGGYIFGKIFKGPRLTKISPNKTYSGAIGSLVCTIVLMHIFFSYFISLNNFQVIIIGLVTSIFCQLGDLFFSYLKRKAKIKDTGNFFPGHGGVLDRIDGILLGLPIGFITLNIIY
ncbi:MAG: hypothetical protein CBC82_07990 [Cellvibrionales bacterium TMED122]|nr:MAG: hypothetical protein CBC82_07990 [Cellvibrionales bacterium TMED122]